MAAKRRAGVADKKTRRLNLQVSEEAAERLLVHAIKARVSPGELVTSLIERGLRDWRVQANHVKGNDRLDTADDVNLTEPIAA
jgi:hypothetical protein